MLASAHVISENRLGRTWKGWSAEGCVFVSCSFSAIHNGVDVEAGNDLVQCFFAEFRPNFFLRCLAQIESNRNRRIRTLHFFFRIGLQIGSVVRESACCDRAKTCKCYNYVQEKLSRGSP